MWPLASRSRFSRTTTKLLQFCSHYAYNAARGHHCFSLHGQQVNDYCAVATCQMILCYYRYYFTQDQIAPACGYTAGNGCPADQSPGYESMSCNHIDASFDNAPTWQKARDQIDALHPFKSGVPGHARACAGYSRTVFTFGGTTEEKLYIYDPWPWNANFAVAGYCHVGGLGFDYPHQLCLHPDQLPLILRPRDARPIVNVDGPRCRRIRSSKPSGERVSDRPHSSRRRMALRCSASCPSRSMGAHAALHGWNCRRRPVMSARSAADHATARRGPTSRSSNTRQQRWWPKPLGSTRPCS